MKILEIHVWVHHIQSMKKFKSYSIHKQPYMQPEHLSIRTFPHKVSQLTPPLPGDMLTAK